MRPKRERRIRLEIKVDSVSSCGLAICGRFTDIMHGVDEINFWGVKV